MFKTAERIAPINFQLYVGGLPEDALPFCFQRTPSCVRSTLKDSIKIRFIGLWSPARTSKRVYINTESVQVSAFEVRPITLRVWRDTDIHLLKISAPSVF